MVPLIIPVFNQLTYLRNLINWWHWYYPEHPVYICNNASNYQPLLDYLFSLKKDNRFYIMNFSENNCPENLNDLIGEYIEKDYDYYAISDPDIMPLPNTPPNFLEIFQHCIDEYKFHRVGFGLKTDDLPDWLEKKGWIIGDENALKDNPYEFEYKEKQYSGFKAPLDTTFALFKSNNGGWYAPMTGEDWGNCLRLFEAYHMTWYLSDNYINKEMDNYFKTCKKFIPGEKISAGKNNNSPLKYR